MIPRTGLAALLTLATALSLPGAAFAQDSGASPEVLEPVADGSKNRFYRGLATGITFYTQIAQSGGWPQVPEGGTLAV